MIFVIKNIGIFGNSLRHMAGLDSVYGYDIAVNDTLDALIKHSNAEKLTIISEPLQFQESLMKRKYHSISKKISLNKSVDFVSDRKSVV